MDRNKLRQPFQAEEVENNWAISYGDMITLLLGFFVIFFNITSETVNLKLIKKNLDKYFDESTRTENGRSPAQAHQTGDENTTPVATSNILNNLKVKSNIEGERVLVEFPGVSFFEAGTDLLTGEGQAALTDFSKAIDPHLGDFRLVVRAYTDPRPLSGKGRFKDNLELSAFRSISAIRHLSTQGVLLENMRIGGYGEASFDRSLQDTRQWQQQRKIVIVIEPLDHTERSQVSQPPHPLPQKPIEEASKAKIVQRIPASVRSLFSSSLKFGSAKNQIKEFIFKVDGQIEENPFYKRFVDFLVYLDLRRKGYSQKDTEQMMKQYKKKQGDQK